jgi:hypothetical protein
VHSKKAAVESGPKKDAAPQGLWRAAAVFVALTQRKLACWKHLSRFCCRTACVSTLYRLLFMAFALASEKEFSGFLRHTQSGHENGWGNGRESGEWKSSLSFMNP